MDFINLPKNKTLNSLSFAVAIACCILLTQSPAQAQQSVPYGYCSITSTTPSTKKNYPYTRVFSDVFDSSTLPEVYKNPKFYREVDRHATQDRDVYNNWDRTLILAHLKSFGFDDTYYVDCYGFTDKAMANWSRNYVVTYLPDTIAYFSTTWPRITKPMPLSKPATDFLAGIVPPKQPESSGRRDSIIVRQLDEAPAKQAVKAAAKPVAKSKPAAKPAPPAEKTWTGCGRKGQPNCRAKPM